MNLSATVISLGNEAFSKRHPKSQWPAWFENAAVVSTSQEPDGKWKFHVNIPLHGPLEKNQSWEVVRGKKMLAIADQKTGDRSIVISISPTAVIEVFGAVIEPIARTVDVVIDKEPSRIELPAGLYRWGESPKC